MYTRDCVIVTPLCTFGQRRCEKPCMQRGNQVFYCISYVGKRNTESRWSTDCSAVDWYLYKTFYLLLIRFNASTEFVLAKGNNLYNPFLTGIHCILYAYESMFFPGAFSRYNIYVSKQQEKKMHDNHYLSNYAVTEENNVNAIL